MGLKEMLWFGITALGSLAILAAWYRPSKTFGGAMASSLVGLFLFIAGLNALWIGITGMMLVNEFFDLFMAMTLAGTLASFFGPIRFWKSRIEFPKHPPS